MVGNARRKFQYDIEARDRGQRAWRRNRKNARGFSRELDKVAKNFRVSELAARGFAAGIGAITLTKLVNGMKDAVQEASRLQKIADKVGVNSEDLQRLQFGFGQAGVNVADMERNLEQFNKRIGEAAFFGGRLADILKANNISLKDSEGNIRPTVELLRDYANLIANAASDQERMTLATEAFGRSGGDMILALRNGAEGMNELMKRTERAGGVMEEKLLRRAEELDDEFDRISRTVDIQLRSGFIQLADAAWQIYTAVDAVADRFEDITNMDGGFLKLLAAPGGALFAPNILGQKVGGAIVDAFNGNGDVAPRGGRVFSGPIGPTFNQNEFDARFSGTGTGRRRTIIPETRRGGSAKAQADAYQRVIERLNIETQAIRLNETQQRILNLQREAGVTATSEQGRAIADKVTQMETERQRLEDLRNAQLEFNQSVEYLQDAGFDAFMSVVDGSESAQEAVKKLGQEILRAATYALLFNRGPLAGLFGGGGGLLSGLFGGLFGARASGGPVDPFGTYRVGENGPELLQMGSRGGRVIPNNRLNDGGTQRVEVILIPQEGALFSQRVGEISGEVAGVVISEAAPDIISTAVQATGQAIRDQPGFAR